MTTLTARFWDTGDAPQSRTGRGGAPRPDPGPVFVHDCITPVDGSTLLLALWKRWDGVDQPPEG